MKDKAMYEIAVARSGLKKSKIAETLMITRQGLWLKENGKVKFSAIEEDAVCDLLKITPAERSAIF